MKDTWNTFTLAGKIVLTTQGRRRNHPATNVLIKAGETMAELINVWIDGHHTLNVGDGITVSGTILKSFGPPDRLFLIVGADDFATRPWEGAWV